MKTDLTPTIKELKKIKGAYKGCTAKYAVDLYNSLTASIKVLEREQWKFDNI